MECRQASARAAADVRSPAAWPPPRPDVRDQRDADGRDVMLVLLNIFMVAAPAAHHRRADRPAGHALSR